MITLMSFYLRINLQHLQKYLGEKSFKYENVMSFWQKGTLQQTYDTFIGEKTYMCEDCTLGHNGSQNAGELMC